MRVEQCLGAVEIRERAAGIAGLHVVARERDVDPGIVRIDLECPLVTSARASRVAELVCLEALDHEPLTRAKLVVAVRHVRYARRRLTRKLQLRAAERERGRRDQN